MNSQARNSLVNKCNLSFIFHTEIDHEAAHGSPRAVYDREFERHDRCIESIERPLLSWTFLVCPAKKNNVKDVYSNIAHDDAIVIAVDGACHNNGKENAKASIGVFVHRNSPWNRSILLSTIQASSSQPNQRQTSQRAELHAYREALKIAISIKKRNNRQVSETFGPYHSLRRVVVKTDSSYLHRAMTEYIDDWKQD